MIHIINEWFQIPGFLWKSSEVNFYNDSDISDKVMLVIVDGENS